jgi:acetyl-CoA carboxylase biotin carboxyl carrier protein
MTLEEIKELVQVVIDSGVAELEITRGDNKVRIKRSSGVTTQEIVVPAQAAAQPVAASVAAAPAPAPATAPATVPAEAAPAEDEGLDYVKSPIVGTFYQAPSPDAPAFVNVGDHVTPGQVLCIIESMKLMNEIEAETAGTIVARLAENSKPVEYGQALFSVKPD